MVKVYRCQFCNYKTVENKVKGMKSAKYKMGLHYNTIHKYLLPTDTTGFRYFYFLLTKKDKGSCVICHNETIFNETAMKYARFCSNPACKEKYKEERNNRMIKKYGKLHLLNDPEQQKKMQQGRRIAGIYEWSDHSGKFGYLSSYEKDFLEYLDNKLQWPSSDIMAPSPHTYEYEYNGTSHYYMPDFFIPSINCEIEIKDDGSAKNINQDSRNKDKIKDELMRSLTNLFNYIKIINKNYSEFEELLKGEEV